MMGGAKAHYDGIVAFSQTDFTEDLKKINVPVRVMHGDDDQNRAICGFCAPLGEAAQEWHTENLQRVSPRHAYDRSRNNQQRSARFL
jgi:pimeloyl-ACP methyl ester carboxylesterase